MKPLIFWELKKRKKYLILWSISIILIVVLILSIYPSIKAQSTTFNNIMKQIPSSVINLKTGGATESIASPVGYLNSQLYFATLPLILIIMSISLGSSILGKDEQDHTLELILARSVSRSKVLLAKLLTLCLMILQHY